MKKPLKIVIEGIGDVVQNYYQKALKLQKLEYKNDLQIIFTDYQKSWLGSDKEKDFMIRRIRIVITDNVVTIEDDEAITETEKIYEKYHREFPVLTPGFAEEINFRNAMIDDALIEEKNVVLYLSSLEVKGGHPENTTFDNLHATDCIFIIENMKIQKLYREDLNSKDKAIEKLDTDVEGALDYIEKSVINEWEIDGKAMEMSFASGVYMLHARFSYDEVIIGWKQAK